jgi:NAD(P)-dependent dehydrogenase (short-subunit alcohol dehydrogenase family)
MPQLQGRTAIVTGGGRGIGKAITRRFVAEGANVVIASRKLENLRAAAVEFKDLPGKTLPVACHVGKKEELERLVAVTEAEFGPADILVNNSATNIGQGPALEVSDEAILKTFEVNVARRDAAHSTDGAEDDGAGAGSIINIASIAGLRPQTGGLVYSSTKAALIMMTRIWAIEFGAKNVRVNAIAPGLIQTDFSSFFWNDDKYMGELKANQPLPRVGQPEEVAGMALFLASDDSSYVTGHVHIVRRRGDRPLDSQSAQEQSRRTSRCVSSASRVRARGYTSCGQPHCGGTRELAQYQPAGSGGSTRRGIRQPAKSQSSKQSDATSPTKDPRPTPAVPSASAAAVASTS